MKSTSWLWPILGGVTFGCLIIMLTGFGWALKETWFPQSGLTLPEAAAPELATSEDWPNKDELYVTALGDSLTKGTGDSTGEGYVSRVIEGLGKAIDKPVYLVNNLALDGLRADQLLNNLEESGFKNAVRKADIILLTIGGNDLFQIAQDSGILSEDGNLSPAIVEERLPEVTPRLKAVFEEIRQLNVNARIVYMGLYNPLYDLTEMKPASNTLAQWNAYAHLLAEADGNATVVPTYDLFEFNLNRYLSSDHYHPNADGYTRIAIRIVQALH